MRMKMFLILSLCAVIEYPEYYAFHGSTSIRKVLCGIPSGISTLLCVESTADY